MTKLMNFLLSSSLLANPVLEKNLEEKVKETAPQEILKHQKNITLVDFSALDDKHYRMVYEQIKDLLEKSKNVDLSEAYHEKSYEYNFKESLRLQTRSLVSFTERHIRIFGSFAASDILEKSLYLLSEVESRFGTDSFSHVLIGRQKYLVSLATKEEISDGPIRIPEKFQQYIGGNIHPWENPHLNYNSINDLPRGSKHIPPNFRSK